MSVQQIRDSQALRAHLDYQQRLVKFEGKTKEKRESSMDEILRDWAQTETVATTYRQRAERVEVDIPEDPFLSVTRQASAPTVAETRNARTQLSEEQESLNQTTSQVPGKLPQIFQQTVRKSQLTTLEKYQFEMQRRRTEAVSELTVYVREMLVASYEDLSQDRSKIQYQLSEFESGYARVIEDEDASPQQLVRDLGQMRQQTQAFLQKFQAQISERLAGFEEAARRGTADAVRRLAGANLTQEQIQESLEAPVFQLNQELKQLQDQFNQLLQCSSERTNALDEDFAARARRSILSRRKTAQTQLLADYKEFVLAQEWSAVIVDALQQCQCAHQLIARDVFDALEKIEHPDRSAAYALAGQFVKSKSVALNALQTLKDTFEGVKQNLKEALDQTAQALVEISMDGHENLSAMLQNWEGRWGKRIAVVQKQSDALIHANGYHVASFIALIGAAEHRRLDASQQDKTLRDALQNVQDQIEQRFARDKERFETTLTQIDHHYEEIWNPQRAALLAQNTESLLDAMEKAAEKRQALLEEAFVGDDSGAIKTAQSLTKLQLEDVFSILGLQNTQLSWSQYAAAEDEVVRKESGVEMALLNKVAAERMLDLGLPKENETGLQRAESTARGAPSPQPGSAAAGKSRSGSARQLQPKTPKRQGAESQLAGGLLLPLPQFEDVDLEEYELRHGFTLRGDGFLAGSFREQMQQLFAQGDDKKKAASGPKKAGKQDASEIPFGLRGVVAGSEPRAIEDVTIPLLKDFRPAFHYVLLSYMREEGRRLAFNSAVQEFRQSLEAWKQQYLLRCSEGEVQRHKQQTEAYNKLLKDWEKRQKAAKGKAFTEPPPEAPAPPQLVQNLPENAQQQLDAVQIPALQQPRPEFFMELIRSLMPVEQLADAPDPEAQWETPIAEALFYDQPGLEEGVMDTSKAGKQKKSRQKDRGAQKQLEETAQPTQGPSLPDPPAALKMLWEDKRLVTHGAASCFEVAFERFIAGEARELQEKYAKIKGFYLTEGEGVLYKAAADTAEIKANILAHRTKYVQSLPLRIRAAFARRNASMQREVDRVSRRATEIALQFRDVDARFQGFSQLYSKSTVYSRPPSADASAPRKGSAGAAQGQGPAKEKEKKAPADSNPQLDAALQKARISQHVRFYTSPQTGQIQLIALQDSFGQTHATFRHLMPEFEAWFASRLRYDRPATLGRQLLYAQDAFVAHAGARMRLLYQTKALQPLAAMRRELGVARREALGWGSAGEGCGFGFVQAAVGLLLSGAAPQETSPIPVQEKPTERPSKKTAPKQPAEAPPRQEAPSHPSVQTYLQLEEQLGMLQEDIQSRYLTDIKAFQKLVGAASEACRLGNQAQIAQAQKKQHASRDTNRIQTVVMGRICNVLAEVEEAEGALDGFQTLFMREVAQPQNTTGSQASILSSMNASRQQKKQEPIIRFKLEHDATKRVAELAELSLRLEFCYYLAGYDRSLEATVFKTPQKYQAGFEQFQQRQKAFFSLLSLLLAHVWTLEKITFGRDLDIKELQQSLQRMTASKNYVSKGRVYVSQNSVDIMTQFQAEYTLLLQKLQGADVSKPLTEEECASDVDWAIYSLQQMGRRLGKEHAALQTRIRDCLVRRDNVLSTVLTNYNTYLTDFYKEISAQTLGEAVSEAQGVQKVFLGQFHAYYDKLRPVLSQMPERRAQLIQEASEYAAAQLQRHQENTQQQLTRLVNQFRLMCSGVLVAPTLYSLSPQVGMEVSVSLQLCALAELRPVGLKERPGTPGKRPDSRSQTGAKGPSKGKKDAQEPAGSGAAAAAPSFRPGAVFSEAELQRISPEEGLGDTKAQTAPKEARKKPTAQEEEPSTFPQFLARALSLLQQAMDSSQVLFSLTEYDQKQLLAAGAAKATPAYLSSPVALKALEPVQDVDALDLTRAPAPSSRPQSKANATADKKKQPATATAALDDPQLPGNVHLPLFQVPMQAWDEEALGDVAKEIGFKPRTKIAGISSADKLSVRAFLDAAENTFKIVEPMARQIAEFKREAQRVQEILQNVASEFHGAVVKLGPPEEPPKQPAAETKARTKK